MECKFVVGQRVVCVVDDFEANLSCREATCPKKGEIVTIDGMEPDRRCGVMLHFAEHPDGLCLCRISRLRMLFEHNGFKPLEHASMSILREIAENPKPIPGELVPAPKRKRETV